MREPATHLQDPSVASRKRDKRRCVFPRGWDPGTNRSQNSEVMWVHSARVTDAAVSLQTLATEAEGSTCLPFFCLPDLGT